MTVSYVVGASLSPPSSARPCAAAAHDVADGGDRGGCEGGSDCCSCKDGGRWREDGWDTEAGIWRCCGLLELIAESDVNTIVRRSPARNLDFSPSLFVSSSLCVRVLVCVCASMFVCACLHVDRSVCFYECMCIHASIYVFVCFCMGAFICMFV